MGLAGAVVRSKDVIGCQTSTGRQDHTAISLLLIEKELPSPNDITMHDVTLESSLGTDYQSNLTKHLPIAMEPEATFGFKDFGWGDTTVPSGYPITRYYHLFDGTFDFDFSRQEELVLTLDVEDLNRAIRAELCFRLYPELEEGSGTYRL